MAKPIRKNVLLDPEGFRRVQEILGTQSAAETIREALNLVVFRQEIIRGFDQVVKALVFGLWGNNSDDPPALRPEHHRAYRLRTIERSAQGGDALQSKGSVSTLPHVCATRNKFTSCSSGVCRGLRKRSRPPGLRSDAVTRIR
jgi:hypothetical protein